MHFLDLRRPSSLKLQGGTFVPDAKKPATFRQRARGSVVLDTESQLLAVVAAVVVASAIIIIRVWGTADVLSIIAIYLAVRASAFARNGAPFRGSWRTRIQSTSVLKRLDARRAVLAELARIIRLAGDREAGGDQNGCASQ